MTTTNNACGRGLCHCHQVVSAWVRERVIRSGGRSTWMDVQRELPVVEPAPDETEVLGRRYLQDCDIERIETEARAAGCPQHLDPRGLLGYRDRFHYPVVYAQHRKNRRCDFYRTVVLYEFGSADEFFVLDIPAPVFVSLPWKEFRLNPGEVSWDAFFEDLADTNEEVVPGPPMAVTAPQAA